MSDENKTSGSGIASLAGAIGWLAVLGGLALVGYGLYLMFTSETQNLAAIQTANNTARLLATGGASVAATNSG
jgi:hypothetical protein